VFWPHRTAAADRAAARSLRDAREFGPRGSVQISRKRVLGAGEPDEVEVLASSRVAAGASERQAVVDTAVDAFGVGFQRVEVLVVGSPAGSF